MLAHHNFGDVEYPSDIAPQLWQHLAHEWAENQDAYGMRVLSNPIQEDSIWMNGPPTWAYLQLSRIHVGFEPVTTTMLCGLRTPCTGHRTLVTS